MSQRMCSYLFLFFIIAFSCHLHADNIGATVGISSNPSASNIATGTGKLGEYLGFKKESGIRLGGLWIGDENYLLTGGRKPHHFLGNSLFQLCLTLDMKPIAGWDGAMFGTEFLQYNGGQTNIAAGCIQGYNSLPGPRPLNRSEWYQYWYRQELLNGKLIIRIGKSIPTYDFTNLVTPISLDDKTMSVSAITSLIYTPIFVIPSLLGIIPGYYNSAFGITITYNPIKSTYFSYGVYDGNMARGKQTGLRGPQFNGYYFHICEAGYSWLLGKEKLPGRIAGGLWDQTGKLKAPHGIKQNGTQGAYIFGTQCLWMQNPGVDNSGIISFFHAGTNNSKTLPMNRFIGAGLTFFGLVPYRDNDSMGCGFSFAQLNKNLFKRKTELLLQAYYQANILEDIYFEPAISYIPWPGASTKLSAAWAITARIITLF